MSRNHPQEGFSVYPREITQNPEDVELTAARPHANLQARLHAVNRIWTGRFMLGWIACTCLIGAMGLLIALSAIDLRVRLLPNKLVLPFALLGVVFHIATAWRYLDLNGVLLGGLAGFGIPYLVRAGANYVYKQDALGLGDVKLMGAAGLWLGPEMVMMALSVGAFAGLMHGIVVGLMTAYKTKSKPHFARLQIPAGPGFAIGIVIVAAYMFQNFRPWE